MKKEFGRIYFETLEEFKEYVISAQKIYHFEILEEPEKNNLGFSVMIKVYQITKWLGNTGSGVIRCFTREEADEIVKSIYKNDWERDSKEFKVTVREEHTWLHPISPVFDKITQTA